MNFEHMSVLLNECIENLKIKKNGIYIDGTMGGAGHSMKIAKILENTGKLICIDQDENAIKVGKERLSCFNNIIFIHSNFSNIIEICSNLNLLNNKINGILLDLGVSSHQLDEGYRGFSYMQDAPLDMRMDFRNKLSAYSVVNTYSKEKLTKIILQYGEERWAKRISNFIELERKNKPIKTTFELVSIIKKAIPKKARLDGPHPAKRTFQAIRIEVNNELEILKDTIINMANLLDKDGRIAIITFHSLEDRIVKNVFKSLENPCICPIDFPVCACGKKPLGKIITKKPIIPTKTELNINHRARSAKLRVFQVK